MTKAGDLLAHAVGAVCLADSSYDAEHFREAIEFVGMKPCIPSHPQRAVQRRPNKKVYALRYLVECFFHELKRFRRLATRYEKTARNYLALIHLACTRLWLTN